MPISKTVQLGSQVEIPKPDLVNLYGCRIGDQTRIGPFVEIQRNSTIGSRCKVSSHSFICEGVTINDEVMIGHGVVFTNDLFPRATTPDGNVQSGEEAASEVASLWEGLQAALQMLGG